MNEDITILLALEARDKASAIIKDLGKTFSNFGMSIKAAAAQATRSGADIEAANTRAEAASASYKRAAAAQTDAQAALSAAMGRSEAAIQAEAAAQARGSDAARAAAAVTADAAKAEEAAYVRLAEAQKLVAARSEEAAAAQKAASTETGVGAGALKGAAVAGAALAVGVVAVGALSVKAAADFQTGAVKLETTAGETHKNIGMVSDGMLQLAADIGTTTANIEGGMYRVESAGFHGANGLNVLRAAGEAARAEGAQMDTVTRALTSALNAYGDTTGKMAVPMTNEIIAAVGRGDMTMEQFAGSLSAVLPIAAAVGLSFAQVGGAVATMTAQGMTADQATQNLAHTIGKLQSPTAAQTKYMQQLGIDTQDLTAKLGERGLTGTIQIISDAIIAHMGPGGKVVVDALNKSKVAAADAQKMLASMPPGLRKVAEEFLNGTVSVGQWRAAVKDLPANQAGMASQFAALVGQADGFNQMLRSGQPDAVNYAAAMKQATGDQTAMNTILKLSGDHAVVFTDNVNAIAAAGKNAGANIAGWDKIQGTFNFKMDQLKGSVEAAKIALGTGLLPIVSAMVGWITKTLTPLTEWITKHKQLAAGALVLVGGLGATVLMLAGVAKAMQLLKVAGEGARIMMVGLRLATIGEDEALMANPIGIIIGLLALLALAIYEAWQHSKTFRDIVIGAWNDLKAATLFLWHDAFEPAFKGIAAVALWLWHNAIEPAWDGIKVAIGVAWAVIKVIWDIIVAEVKILGAIFTWLWKNILEPVWQGIQIAVSIAWAIIQVIWGLIQIEIKILAAIFTWLWRDVIEPVWRGISAVIQWAWNNMIRPIWDLIKMEIQGLGVIFNWLWHSVIEPVWHGISSAISTVWNNLIKPVFHAFGDFIKSDVSPAFKAGVDAIGKAWHGVQDIAKAPIKFVVNTVLNDGLLAAYNKVASIFHVSPNNVHVNLPAGFAEGGQIPGVPSTKDNMLAMVATGEYIMPTDKTRRYLPILEAMRAGALPHYPGDLSGLGIRGYAGGGIVGALSNIGSGIWDLFTNPAKLLAGPINAVINSIPGAGSIRDVVVGGAHKLLDGLIKWVTGAGDSAGGPAMAFLKAQVGKPYGWDQAGPDAFDCSGLLSAVYNVIKGHNPYSHTFSTGNEAGFFPIPGLGGILSAGWTNPGEHGPGGNSVGHTAGVLAGIPFESTGSRGVHMGAGVTPIGSFAHVGHFNMGGIVKALSMDDGRGVLAPGLNLVHNGTGRREPISATDGGPQVVNININEPHIMSDRDIDWLLDRLDKRLARVMVPGAGIQVRR